MTLLLRILLYTVCLFMVCVVYTGQKHTTAAGTLRAAGRSTVRLLLWTAVGVVVMFALEWLFID